jgi:hypothetical protein
MLHMRFACGRIWRRMGVALGRHIKMIGERELPLM